MQTLCKCCKCYANGMHFDSTNLDKKPRAKYCANAMLILCNYNPNAMQMLCKCYANAMQMLFKCYVIAMHMLYKCYAWKFSNVYGNSQMTMENLKWLWKISNDYEGLKVPEWRYKREKN